MTAAVMPRALASSSGKPSCNAFAYVKVASSSNLPTARGRAARLYEDVARGSTWKELPQVPQVTSPAGGSKSGPATVAILPSAIRTVPPSMGSPSTGTTYPPVIAMLLLATPPPFPDAFGLTSLSFHRAPMNARALAVLLNAQVLPLEDPLGPLRRRWIAAMLSGMASRRPTSSNLLADSMTSR